MLIFKVRNSLYTLKLNFTRFPLMYKLR